MIVSCSCWTQTRIKLVDWNQVFIWQLTTILASCTVGRMLFDIFGQAITQFQWKKWLLGKLYRLCFCFDYFLFCFSSRMLLFCILWIIYGAVKCQSQNIWSCVFYLVFIFIMTPGEKSSLCNQGSCLFWTEVKFIHYLLARGQFSRDGSCLLIFQLGYWSPNRAIIMSRV